MKSLLFNKNLHIFVYILEIILCKQIMVNYYELEEREK